MSRRPTWKIVHSSLLRFVYYNPKTRTLHLLFQSNRYYIYKDVSYYTYRRLMTSESKGQFFNSRIRDKYKYEQIKVDSKL